MMNLKVEVTTKMQIKYEAACEDVAKDDYEDSGENERRALLPRVF